MLDGVVGVVGEGVVRDGEVVESSEGLGDGEGEGEGEGEGLGDGEDWAALCPPSSSSPPSLCRRWIATPS